MTPPKVAKQLRIIRRTQRLGVAPVCLYCGEDDPRVLEEQHTLTREVARDVAHILCRNCHARETSEQRDAGAIVDGSPARRPHPAATTLRGISVLFDQLSPVLRRIADDLETDHG